MEQKLVKITVKKPTKITGKDKLSSDQIDISLGGSMSISKITFLNNSCSSISVRLKTTESGWKLAKKYIFSRKGMAFNLKQIIVSSPYCQPHLIVYLQEFNTPVSATMVRFISRGFDSDSIGSLANIMVYRSVPLPKNPLIDLVHLNNDIHLTENWKIIEKLILLEPSRYEI